MMKGIFSIVILLLLSAGTLKAQDSMLVRVHPQYDQVGWIQRALFGENYRKEWAMEVNVPVLRLSKFQGGLHPTELGGGMQSRSLRVTDTSGREWVMRSIEKRPDLVIPLRFRETFVRDLVDDATSDQHPFSALIVPKLGDALQIPHLEPVLMYVAPDPLLGEYDSLFSNTVVLLEPRSVKGKSENTEKVLKDLFHDNLNTFDAATFLKARVLDLLLADWDRHADQWRWQLMNTDQGKKYLPVPRDRDQVLSVTQGALPVLIKGLYVMPRVPGFSKKMKKPDHYLFKSGFLNADYAAQFSLEQWNTIVKQAVDALSDSVLSAAVASLPEPAYQLRGKYFLESLKARRDAIPAAMEGYYLFSNKIVDVRLTDSPEQVMITDSTGGTVIRAYDLLRPGRLLFSKFYPAALTREIRLYTLNGNDSIVVNRSAAATKLRIITEAGDKSLSVNGTASQLKLYQQAANIRFYGSKKPRRVYEQDTLNGFTPVNLYHLVFPLMTIGVNPDDGFMFGAGIQLQRQRGFRKFPYASQHRLLFAHSFSTDAYRLNYSSEWKNVFRKTDIITEVNINAPRNTYNYFGQGSGSVFDEGKGIEFYRTRFNSYSLNTGLKRAVGKHWSVYLGPSLHLYAVDSNENNGKFITQATQVGTYDSLIINRNKFHLGAKLGINFSDIDRIFLPTKGLGASLTVAGYKGVSQFARDLVQLNSSFYFHLPLNNNHTLVFSNRTGGIATIGTPGFYQSAFLGGQGNLLGYRQFRFAGRHAFYNNTELRIKLTYLHSYLLPGELGLRSFFDLGRVWVKDDVSDRWHNGAGAGLYYGVAEMLILNFAAGYSPDGWYPFFSVGLRF
ncbi:MAG: hypothetical protein DI535_18205 [Citrobacter freundii]|nr:MAG: hypothetical protein DI535_18205 [Citrobacter freundii]